MHKFLQCYEQLRDREKLKISEGYQEKHLSKGKRVYGRLIKLFASRSEAADFRRRPTVLDRSETLGGVAGRSSPRAVPVKVVTKDQESQAGVSISDWVE